MHGLTICEVALAGTRYRALLDCPLALYVPLEFEMAVPGGGEAPVAARQPNHFAAPPATARPLQVDGFTGDTRQGGSCNACTLELTPHCNGTHTEGVGHLTGERLSVDTLLLDAVMAATLVSVSPVAAGDSAEHARHALAAGDELITAAALERALAHAPETPALIVRTLPNGEEKKTRRYAGASPAPFFSLEAARLVVERRVRHLLVDLPSLDRAHDEGLLGAHREFWGLSHSPAAPARARRHCTITEMIYAPDTIEDGMYLLNLQIAPFVSDAAPSRPLLFPLEPS